ncbi:MAG: prepilin-type N-terminal cleavage/methylation domain-containing protein [bacterium]
MKLNKGFTLIEVMIALMILAITLIALSSGQGVALSSTRKAKLTTMATIAAKNMMADIEIMSEVKGVTYVKDLGEKAEGEFTDDEYKGWKWTREVKEVTFPLSAIMKMFTAQEKAAGESEGEQTPLGGGAEAQILDLVSTNIEKLMKDSIREITVTVSWPVKAGKAFSSMKLVYYVVDFETVQNFVPVM